MKGVLQWLFLKASLMVKGKKIGSLAPRFFSFVGYQTRADEVALEMGPNIAAAMAEDKVTLALIVPV
jgi:hypothetical protein